ncbi:hypothetical protein [Burkholderia sp. BCC0405]|uniref:hypothetical protein n=1 Tax=Burkholderia sp. BCC0405 TaxID=2676298 RepID=UPI001FC7E389|nr:hypothetical protein [Burkholderia sp. BCC0405]
MELERQLHTAQTRLMHDPRDLVTIREICETLIALKREDELLVWADRALALSPHDPNFVTMRATALDLLGQHAEAAVTWQRESSLPYAPGFYPLQLGYSLMMAGDFAQAIPLLENARRTALAAHAPWAARAAHLYGEALLKAGDGQGFAHWLMRNEDAASTGTYCPSDVPLWTGQTDLRGQRVLVTHQLGLGDQFMLNACLADWLAAGAKVMLTCDLQIQALMQASLPDCEVVAAPRPLHLRVAPVDDMRLRVEAFAPHLYATLLHLPLLKAVEPGYRFRPYQRAPRVKERAAAAWARRLRAQYPGKKLVGLFWDCNQRHTPDLGSAMRCWATRRSVPLAMVNGLVTDPTLTEQVHFVNLHHPLVEAEAGTPAGNISRYQPEIWSFDDTAACIGQLDAVVSVDSAVANLSAMMGRPTCVLVSTSGDWRWSGQGTTARWIEGVTVLRQVQEGNWDAVMRDAAVWLASH